jgi:hypothetical protein
MVTQAQSDNREYSPARQWDNVVGSKGPDYLSSMLVTKDGGYLLSGYSSSGTGEDKSQESRGGFDYWLVKTDSLGKKRWDKRYGGTSDDVLSSVIQNSDGSFLLCGYTASGLGADKTQESRGDLDYWVVKIDSVGTKLWDKRFGGSGTDILRFGAQTEDGGYLLAGNSSSTASGDKTQQSQGVEDYWIVKIDSAGTKLWDRRYGGSNAEFLSSAVSINEQGYLLAGTSYSGIGGDKSQDSREGWDYWVLKIDTEGNKLWDRRFGGSRSDFPAQIIQTADENYLLAGISDSDKGADKSQNSLGGWDYWLVKIDKQGNKLWDQRYGGTLNDDLNVIIESRDGHYVLAGSSDSGMGEDKSEESRGGFDYWLVKVSKDDGAKVWDKTFGGTADDQLFALAQTSVGNYLLAGHSSSPNSGDKMQASKGSYDYWMLTTTPEKGIDPLVKVNFGNKDTKAPTGWIQDYGLPFGKKIVAQTGLLWNYGWKSKQDNSPVDLSVGGPFPGNGRWRSTPADTLQASLMHMQGNDVKNFKGTPVEAYWEMAVENGEYQVTVSVGDGAIWYFNEEYHSINVEGIPAIDRFLPTGQAGSMSRFKQATLQVTVTDELLTIDATGGQNTKINYVTIQPLSSNNTAAKGSIASFQQSATTIKVYPNPFTDQLRLDVKGWQGRVTITLQDILGNTLYQTQQQVENNSLALDLTNFELQKGMYLIKLTNEQGATQSVKALKR